MPVGSTVKVFTDVTLVRYHALAKSESKYEEYYQDLLHSRVTNVTVLIGMRFVTNG